MNRHKKGNKLQRPDGSLHIPVSNTQITRIQASEDLLEFFPSLIRVSNCMAEFLDLDCDKRMQSLEAKYELHRLPSPSYLLEKKLTPPLCIARNRGHVSQMRTYTNLQTRILHELTDVSASAPGLKIFGL